MPYVSVILVGQERTVLSFTATTCTTVLVMVNVWVPTRASAIPDIWLVSFFLIFLYEDVIDHRSYAHNLNSCEIKVARNSFQHLYFDGSLRYNHSLSLDAAIMASQKLPNLW